jgi:hypothetical protein
VALIQLSEVHSLFDIPSSNDGKRDERGRRNETNFLPVDYEQFGMLCSIDGQARQLVFRVADNSNMTLPRSQFTESMTSLSAVPSLNQTNKTEVFQRLAKAIAEERCLLDKVGAKDALTTIY